MLVVSFPLGLSISPEIPLKHMKPHWKTIDGRLGCLAGMWLSPLQCGRSYGLHQILLLIPVSRARISPWKSSRIWDESHPDGKRGRK